MKDFIEALFESQQRLTFQYKNYSVSFYSGQYKSYYMIFFLKNQEELLSLWKEREELFQKIKDSEDIYESGMDKNILCLYCLEASDEEYYETFETGTINELSKKISLIEEDLSYFTKHVFLYTQKMQQFAQEHVGKFESVCRQYIANEQFISYKEDSRGNYVYDFLMNLFIKLPFLRFEVYQRENQKEYRTVESFIQEKMEIYSIDQEKIKSIVRQLEEQVEDEDKFYGWLDTLTD
ncbi:hypothetical protein GCM10008910_13420 [Faecalicatena orotica]|uniref:Uncharacterized protein n=1 Tax=Faecalicatena orotica TaxID=1544 RepID=A0A2Y9BE75_9FIRM|nr:ABC-three component system middle component 1 [Faecalicatena orotica]PWJ31385.1 hypothetical protein A8806_102241 [Faecalicatena orotica]SSA54591.1 hypothetical protein SAMN05216536_102241 [Faecalicatena orotica]